MLVLKRSVGERIIIGDGLITVTLVKVECNSARIGIEAPRDIHVHREEVQRSVDSEGSKRPQ